MAKKAVVILAEGFEEIEAVTPIDVLRRAGVEVTVAGVGSKEVTGAHGIKFEAEIQLDSYDELPDAVILPGGLPGAKNLGESKKVRELIWKMTEAGKLVGAICAAPALVLEPAGILKGKRATCYPGFEKDFSSDVSFSESRVVVDGNVITSRGPGSALEFALELTEKLAGRSKAEELRRALLAQPAV